MALTQANCQCQRHLLRYLLILVAWLVVCAAVVGVVHADPVEPAPVLSNCVQAAAPRYESLEVGRHLVFVCTDALGVKAYPDGLSCHHSVCNPSAFAAAVMRIATAGDYKKAVDTEWAASVKWTCDAPPDDRARALCVERKAWIARNWTAWTAEFKPAAWKVKANGTATTRPAYALVNGVLGTKEVGRAPIGAACDVTRPMAPATGGDLRAEYGTTGLVTICTKSQP